MIGKLTYFSIFKSKRRMEVPSFLNQNAQMTSYINSNRLVKHCSTTMSPSTYINKNEIRDPVLRKAKSIYDDRLLGLITSRPDIMFTVFLCLLSIYPKIISLKSFKRIFWYLKLTINLRLWNPKGIKFDLKGYFDIDFLWCSTNRHKWNLYFLRYCFVSWFSKNSICYLCPRLKPSI